MTYEIVEKKYHEPVKIKDSISAVEFLKPYKDANQEHFLCIHLDASHNVIECCICSIGSVNSTVVAPRDVFRDAIKNNASAIILAHNHPSGNTDPSKHDIETTEKLVECGEIIGIPVLDHIVFGPAGNYYSFMASGIIGRT